MLNEPASSLDDQQPPLPEAETDPHDTPDSALQQQRHALRRMVEEVFTIETEKFPDDEAHRPDGVPILTLKSELLASFYGKLTLDSETAYAQLDAACQPLNMLPVFREEQEKQVIHIIEGRVIPEQGGGWLSLILFVMTVFSVLYVGAMMAINEIGATDLPRALELSENMTAQLWRGLPYAASILLILGAHELGHYFMSRWHGVAASLPYFIPFPISLFGTLGAAIRLREPMRNRKILLDVGAAGPLAGLIFALPILFIGLATSHVGTISGEGLVEGNSILYALAKIITFGRFLPDGSSDVFVNQLAWAGWTGLFVTGLNLIPLGQLDGGHIIYSLVGFRARYLYYPVIISVALLAAFASPALMLLLLLLIFLGRFYARPLDDITPLDRRRRALAVFTLVVFCLVFVPIPLSQYTAEGTQIIPGSSAHLIAVTGLVLAWQAHHRQARRRLL